ncbi:class I adenylate-forming enzyme family protein [Alicyclobacillus ferrooxydans]|uniref:AMP-dependent synthetase n=1 Tax=Alicyclobacillus ferrooxydans TaxID=471514 RepID=A0A0P9ELT8_9BACL|nr:long-chain-fatty-acid--CoA ligase [Alicyclobacillus ferrooxydans]KPV44265.1 AMP-dependent synthetase [Alicyclobacillus ferrooxydans]
MNLKTLLEINIEQFGEYPFLYFGDKTYTNVDTRNLANQMAATLAGLGVHPGDRVMVCMPNLPEVVIGYQAVIRAKAIIVPVMYLLHQQEIAFIMEDSETKVVLTSEAMLDKVTAAAAAATRPPRVIVVDGPSRDGAQGLYDLMGQAKSEQDPGDGDRDDAPKDDDIAVILYTSGTTGKPKGVCLTHKNLYSNADSSARNGERERGTTIGVLPLAHVYGLTVANICYLTGSSIVVFSKFDTVSVFEAIERYKVRGFSGVPAMVHAMVMDPRSEHYDLSSLEFVGSGSAPLPLALSQAFKNKFGAEVYEGYGLSEAAPVVTAHRRDIPHKQGSVGVPIPGVEIRIVDDSGNELPPGEVGELIVKGDNVTPGYYKNEAASRAALRDGWLYTGDLGKIDEDGYLFIVDRKKDLIIRGGFNIYPRDLEELLLRHAAVSEAAVIGVPSERMGEEVVAYVVPKPGTEPTEDELLVYCQEHLAKYKTPRRVLVVEGLPRNGVGKILKTKLKELARETALNIS